MLSAPLFVVIIILSFRLMIIVGAWTQRLR
jgi:hypothetical protein